VTFLEPIDVGVVTWNTRDLTVGALRRLVDSYPADLLRLLVRDNGSHDGTAEAIAAAVPHAEVEAGEDNLGFAGGMNRLLERSEAPWFLCLNPDAWPLPGGIQALLAAARRHERAAAVAPRLEQPDGTLEHSTHRFPSLRLAAAAAAPPSLIGRRLGDRMLLEGAWSHDRLRQVDWAVGAALLMRRSAIESVGGFDERFFMYAEDLEWCWRARRRGWEIWFDPTARFTHVGNASGAQRYRARRSAAYFRNTYRFYRREHGAAAMRVYRNLNLVGSARQWAGARMRGDHEAMKYWRRVARVHRESVQEVDVHPPVAD
jgi:GT2 family glycosyltransferase